ncbi:MAG: Peptidase sortase [Blastococcus sp.]|nr:Peptidase sortase [Blastococcus sp.]
MAIVLASVGIGAVLPDVDAATASSSPYSLAPSIELAAPAPLTPPQLPPAAEPGSLMSPMPASVPVGLAIPALGVTSAVIGLGLEDDGSMEVPPGAYPAGWYDQSPTPGELGPAILAAHVDWGGKPGVFHAIRDLQPGDEVSVARQDGSIATFRVDRVDEYAKEAFPTDAVYGDLDHAGLRLITCGGDFDDDSGSYEDNIVVFATFTGTG